jgi:ATP-binding cassette subfamily F protein uup
VSHDRWFLERVTDGVAALTGDGRLAALPGGVDEYLALRRAEADDRATAALRSSRRGGDTRAQQRQRTKELQRLERLIERLNRREEELHEQLAESATDAPAVVALDASLRETLAEREKAEDSWLGMATEEP